LRTIQIVKLRPLIKYKVYQSDYSREPSAEDLILSLLKIWELFK